MSAQTDLRSHVSPRARVATHLICFRVRRTGFDVRAQTEIENL
jgi:hypothetical protein